MTVRRCLFIACVTWGLAPAISHGQIAELATKSQQGANTVLAIDVTALKSAPMATERGWTSKLEKAFVDRSIFLPPEANSVVVFGQLATDQGFSSLSEVAVMKLARPVSMAGIARSNGGQLDELRGRQAVATTSDAYLVSLANDVLGIYSPASRQAAAKWVADASENRGNNLSAYLKQAVSKASSTRQIILAIDLQDALSVNDVLANVKALKLPSGTTLKPEDIAAQLQTIRGVTIEVAVGKSARSTTQIDFGKPVTFSSPLAKTLVIGAMQRLGIDVPDVADHQFKVAGSVIVAEGDLSSAGLRRVMSLLEVPTASLSESDAPSGSTTTTSSDDMAARSQVYFKSVVSLLDDLRGDRTKQDPRGSMDAVWMDKYATKIDRLPILGVDDDLLTWGANTAQTLRVMAAERRGRSLSAGASKSGLRTGVSYDGYYGVSVNSATATQADANQIDVTQGNIATAKRVEGWRLIDNAMADIRKKETQRYHVEF